jgi:hypothetical protein
MPLASKEIRGHNLQLELKVHRGFLVTQAYKDRREIRDFKVISPLE